MRLTAESVKYGNLRIHSNTVVPNRWVAEEFLWGREQQPQQFAKSQIFRTAHINILCYISKTETQIDFCEVHLVTIIIPVWFLL